MTFAGRFGWCGLVLIWVGLVAYGIGLWTAYDQRPGEIPDSTAASVPPSGSAGFWRVLMFIHPHCPCSQASVGELRRMLHQLAEAAQEGSVQASILVVRPPEAPAGWEQGDILSEIQGWNEVSVIIDQGGEEAKRWKVTTSGHVIVLDPQGRVRFRGGITPGRGQQGSSAGSLRIVQIIREASCAVGVDDSCASETDEKKVPGETVRPVVTAPVYGCPLWTPRNNTCDGSLEVDQEEAR